MASLWTKTGVLKLCASGALAFQTTCPCSGPTACPGSCPVPPYPSTYHCVTSGFASPCTAYNTGAGGITLTKTNCVYAGNIGPNIIQLSCAGTTWTMTVRNFMGVAIATGTISNTTGYPTGTYNLTGTGACAGTTGTGVVT